MEKMNRPPVVKNHERERITNGPSTLSTGRLGGRGGGGGLGYISGPSCEAFVTNFKMTHFTGVNFMSIATPQ